MELARFWRHLLHSPATLRRCFSEAALRRIESAVHASEKEHSGEIRIAVEGDLGLRALLRDKTPRQRALEVFSHLGVWDTPRNNGVLVYLLLADRDVEIVADRGFNGLVEAAEWEAVCVLMEAEFAKGHWEQGLVSGVEAVSRIVATHFPAFDRDLDSVGLPNRPTLL
ncbi:MAG: TPM domain-containing protein [Candidatus Binatia bacterium]